MQSTDVLLYFYHKLANVYLYYFISILKFLNILWPIDYYWYNILDILYNLYA